MMFRLHKGYLLAAILLFLIEVCIALFVHDAIIRPYIGDTLVVILIYCFVLSFLQLSPLKAALGTLLFSYIIETLQYLNIVQVLGLGHSNLANIIIGNSFAWMDIVAYTAGFIIILVWEYTIKPKELRGNKK